MSTPDNSKDTVLIWDMPTRIFHWATVLAFTTAWVTAANDLFLYHHVFGGYLFIGLLIFRLVWGMIGSHYAKFLSFAHHWTSATDYLKGLMTGQAARYLGHNPAGSYAIFAILILGVVVTVTGLFVLGGEEGHGPLKGLIGYDFGVASKEVHEAIAVAMLVLVGLHLCGVVVESLYHKENLIWAMITGHKPPHDEAEHVNVHALIAVLMLGGIFGSTVYYFYDYLTQTKDRPFLAFTNDPLPDNETWRSECSDCHLAFHPVLLPKRSWQRIMDEQDKHFEEDLSLDEDVAAEITAFLLTNASEVGHTEVANKMARRIPPDKTPIRITDTEYWKSKHNEEYIEPIYWKSKQVKSKSNCGACHKDAKQGWFDDSNMELPKLKE